jgi:hypothetical protein
VAADCLNALSKSAWTSGHSFLHAWLASPAWMCYMQMQRWHYSSRLPAVSSHYMQAEHNKHINTCMAAVLSLRFSLVAGRAVEFGHMNRGACMHAWKEWRSAIPFGFACAIRFAANFWCIRHLDFMLSSSETLYSYMFAACYGWLVAQSSKLYSMYYMVFILVSSLGWLY